MLFPKKLTALLVCALFLISGGLVSACNLSSLTLNSSASLGGGLYQFNLTMCSPGGCDGVDIFGTCIGSEMNDNTGNWSIGVPPPTTITNFTPNISSPITGSVFNGALTSASTFVNYTNATSWWTYETTSIVPTQALCVNLTIVTNGVPSEICVYGLEGADLIFLPPACPQVVGTTCIVPGPLDVEFIDFNAKVEGDAVNLAWRTAMETNHDKFVIERSPDGNHYEPLGDVPGAGESTVEQQYDFMDFRPEPGSNYYRVAAVDMGGLAQYTEAVQVLYEPQNFRMDRAYPNPAIDHSTIEFIATEEGKGVAVVFDLQGRQVLTQEISIEAGRNTFELEMGNWARGTYSVLIAGNGGKISTKIQKQ